MTPAEGKKIAVLIEERGGYLTDNLQGVEMIIVLRLSALGGAPVPETGRVATCDRCGEEVIVSAFALAGAPTAALVCTTCVNEHEPVEGVLVRRTDHSGAPGDSGGTS